MLAVFRKRTLDDAIEQIEHATAEAVPEAEQPANTEAARSEPGFLQRMREHRLVSYFTVSSTVGLVPSLTAKGAGYLTGFQLRLDDLIRKIGITDSVGPYLTSALMNAASTLVNFGMDMAVTRRVIYGINRDLYTGEEGRRDFNRRYVLFSTVNHAFSGATNWLTVGSMLNHNVPIAVIALTSGLVTFFPNLIAKTLLFNNVVLQESIPEQARTIKQSIMQWADYVQEQAVRQSGNAERMAASAAATALMAANTLGAASHAVKAAIYTAPAFIPTGVAGVIAGTSRFSA